jgi:CheY-like chemotaxis protein
MNGPVEGRAAPARSQAPRPGSGVEPADGVEPRVLVVDDEPEIRSLYAEWLRRTCEVVTAATAGAALDVIDGDADLDVVLTDRRLPDRSGDEVVRAVAAGDRGVRVVVVSAAEPDLDVADLPFDAYLTKPVGRDRLRTTVRWVHAHERRDPAVVTYLTRDHKVALLERSAVTVELSTAPAYRRLRAARDEAKGRVDRRLADDPPATSEVGRPAEK